MAEKSGAALRTVRWAVVTVAVGLLLTGCGGPSSPAPDAGDGELAELRAALRKNPRDVALRLRLGRAHLRAGDAASAESYFRRALADGATDARAGGDLVRALLMQEKYFQAQEFLRPRLAAAGDDNARLWLLRAEAVAGQANANEREVRAAFIDAYRHLADADDAESMSRLRALSDRHPIAAAARAHFECRAQPPEPIDPPAAAPAAGGRVLSVGPSRDLKTPSQAARVAKDGDVVEIDAGVYRADVAVWRQDGIVLRGVGGIAQLEAAGRVADGKAIWVFDGDDITAENIAFSGARARHRNGAGIRLQGVGATIRNCRFHDNENGILGGSPVGEVDGNDVLIEFSEFERNGYGDGQSHNIYVGRVSSFTLRYSYSHASRVGHLVKSRARHNAILFNRLIDGQDGDGSYVIDLPEGGQAWIVGNELEKGSAAQNPIMISFGEERAERDDQALYVVNNTFYNNVLDAKIIRNATTAPAVVVNNIIAGAPAILLVGPGSESHSLRRPGAWFEDAAAYDFRLTPQAPAIDGGVDPATIDGLRYLPDAEYQHPARGQTRAAVAAVDIGAREFCGL